MRSLPISVIPFAGETVQSIYRRLSAYNAVTTGELWTTIRAAHPHLPLRTLPELVPRVVEELASLPEGYFDRQNARDRLFVRCVHADWEHNNCVKCAPLPSPSSMCKRCANGDDVVTRTRRGAVCTRHQRWHYAGADEDISGLASFHRAERHLRGPLWERGVGLDTGELELAAQLVHALRAQGGNEGVPLEHADRLRAVYPEAVRLVALLTEPWAVRFLANKRIGFVPVSVMIERATAAVEKHSRRDEDAVRTGFRIEGREAEVHIGRTIRLRYGRSPGLTAFGLQAQALAPTLRATLLRHTDARLPRMHRPTRVLA